MPDIVLNTVFDNPHLPTVQFPGFSDTFNAADGPLDYTTDGKPWLNWGGGTWVRQGGAAKLTASPAIAVYVVVDALASDGVFTHVIRDSGPNAVGGVCFRAVDADNMLRLTWRSTESTQKYNMVQRVGGASSTLIGPNAHNKVTADGDVVEISLDGPNITLTVNDVVLGAASTSNHLTATKFGLYNTNAGPTANGLDALVESIEFVPS